MCTLDSPGLDLHSLKVLWYVWLQSFPYCNLGLSISYFFSASQTFCNVFLSLPSCSNTTHCSCSLNPFFPFLSGLPQHTLIFLYIDLNRILSFSGPLFHSITIPLHHHPTIHCCTHTIPLFHQHRCIFSSLSHLLLPKLYLILSTYMLSVASILHKSISIDLESTTHRKLGQALTNLFGTYA